MAERYRRFVTSVPAATLTTVYTAPDDGVVGNLGSAESVIIGFLIANTSTAAAEITVDLVDHYNNTTPLTVKIADTIPLPADSTVDIVPGKLVLQHAPRETTEALTGDILNITSTQTCDVTISVVERV